ncbi:DedA family protein [Chlorobium sp. KB01]|uniref:DedA family protein n=1 Tax=Chlorobium sp. KB01 TaxID=1917528 RepID=UPI00097749C7|nr:DedA family protein [Chlorobium sp. KB01]
MLESAISYLQHADPVSVYLFLFLIAFLENVIPPIPGDVPVAFIGYLIYSSSLTFAGTVLWASMGSVSGFMVVFLLSKHFGLKLYSGGDTPAQHWFSQRVHRFFPPSDMELLRRKFATHGYLAVLLNRFLFGSRAVISVMAGLMHLKTLFVLLAAAVSALLWNVLLLYGGYFLGSNWKNIGGYVALYSIPVTIFFVLLIIFSVWKFIRERKRQHE